MDVIDLKIGPFKEDYSALQLLQWICNMNGVCGVIDQTTGEFDYKFVNSEKRTTTADSNYKGEFNSAQSIALVMWLNLVIHMERKDITKKL